MISTVFEPTPAGPVDAPIALKLARDAAAILAPDCVITMSEDRATFVLESAATKRARIVRIAVRPDFTIHASTLVDLMNNVRWFAGFPAASK